MNASEIDVEALNGVLVEQQHQIAQLKQMLQAITPKKGLASDKFTDINDVRVPSPNLQWPRHVYRRSEKHAKALDHPGFETCLVDSSQHLAQLVEAGWVEDLDQAPALKAAASEGPRANPDRSKKP